MARFRRVPLIGWRITSSNTTSVAFAALTTSQAPQHLYEELEILDWRVWSFDTDSVIHEYQKNAYNIPNGKHLGQREYETKNKPITEFVSISPKSCDDKYNGKCKVKFKGFMLNHENQGVINFQSIKYLVDGKARSLTTANLDFKRSNITECISTFDDDKVALLVYNKRQIVDTYDTLPFG